jgi:coproporphyrinogen III oxidase-like Fe-S oxidoreductase
MEILARLQELQAESRFDTLNADMIFNFPSQTEDMLIHDLACILESGVTQTTFYPLMASPAVERSLAATVGKVDYRREREFYRIISEVLTNPEIAGQNIGGQEAGSRHGEAGSRHGEAGTQSIAAPRRAPFKGGSAWTFNASTQAMIDEYIVDYEEYPAIGSGSFSYLNGSLYVNTFSINEYIKRIDAGQMSIAGKVNFTPYDRMRYRFMMQLFGLRLDKRQWEQDFGCSVAGGVPAEYAFYKAVGAFATDTPEELTLTPKGRYLLVALMRQFFVGVNGVRDGARSSLPPEERLYFGC